MENFLPYLIGGFLQKNKIVIDKNELEFQILSHPTYPSLHSITGVLDHFGIDNLALDIPKNTETLAQLPTFFLTYIKNQEGQHFVLVVNKGLSYQLVFSKTKKITVSLNDFLELFTGIVVVVEKNEITTSIESTSTINYKKILFCIALLFFVTIFFLFQPNNFAIAHFILSLVGVGISILIIQHDLGINSKIVDRICSEENKTTNCNAVLNSKGSLLFNTFKLSDISFTYFSSICLSLILLSFSKENDTIISGVSMLTILGVIYSIYYQFFVVKTWCSLCLGIVLILLLQIVTSIVCLNVPIANFSVSIKSSILAAFSFVSIAAVWLFISDKLKKGKEYKTLKIAHTKFKRNYNLFNTLLNKSEVINTTIPDIPEIIFGNKIAMLRITVITNPFCGHCKEVHTIIESILKKYESQVQICIRFNINITSDTSSELEKVTTRLLDIYYTSNNKNTCLEAMHDIYIDLTPKEWFKKWRECSFPTVINYGSILKKENTWCKKENINFTPEILINGKTYPKEYDRDDLIYFIEELIEEI